jgi:hypothetical protein
MVKRLVAVAPVSRFDAAKLIGLPGHVKPSRGSFNVTRYSTAVSWTHAVVLKNAVCPLPA